MKDTLSRNWYLRFMKRHPILSHCVTQSDNIKKINDWTLGAAEKWIEVLADLEKDGCLSDPRGIYNFDETGIKLGITASKTITRREKACVRSLMSGEKYWTAFILNLKNG